MTQRGVASAVADVPGGGTSGIWKIIAASAVGTMIEWYDFYIFGSLAAYLAAVLSRREPHLVAPRVLATFAVGFAVRPFGALFFGRIGDLVGRKYAFLVTLLIMGGSTAPSGSCQRTPDRHRWRRSSCCHPRLTGAGARRRVRRGCRLRRRACSRQKARVLHELHPDDGDPGPLRLAAGILIVQRVVPEDFQAWGWRIPFLVSIFLVAISLYISLRLQESPVFAQMKAAGMTSIAPILESFGSWSKWKTILTVLWGAAAGQAVVWYCGQFYALFWLQNSNQALGDDGKIANLGNIPSADANVIIAVALCWPPRSSSSSAHSQTGSVASR